MELKQLRYFLTVAEMQHITRAAEELHIAQPALSQIIQRLEGELGVPLFDRKNRGIILNANGKLFQERLVPILRELDRLADEMKESDIRRRNTIHINIIAAYSMIAEYIIAYQRIRPETHFQLTRSFTPTDCDFMVTNKHPNDSMHDCEELMTERFFLAVPASLEIAEKKSICLKEVENEDFIMCSRKSPIRIMCEHFCTTAGFLPKVSFESENPELARMLIGAGMGVGFWPEHSWGGVRDARLLHIEEPDCRRSIVSIPPVDQIRNEAAVEFIDFLKNSSIPGKRSS